MPLGNILPSDVDGTKPPPDGSPNYQIALGLKVDLEKAMIAGVLGLWQFHVDWTDLKKSTYNGPSLVNGVANFTLPCVAGGACIPQPGRDATKLESLGLYAMYRLAYRNSTDHEILVVNHTVKARNESDVTGIRWYELRKSGKNPFSVYQQGIFAPDNSFRWVGSIAMDKVGNMALGYSVSDTKIYPSIRYTGRKPDDKKGEMEAEAKIIDGTHSQEDDRWGDYSSMAVDSDDCTFWYTTQYDGDPGTRKTVVWSTQITALKFPSCK
jgi:hypothetical protein